MRRWLLVVTLVFAMLGSIPVSMFSPAAVAADMAGASTVTAQAKPKVKVSWSKSKSIKCRKPPIRETNQSVNVRLQCKADESIEDNGKIIRMNAKSYARGGGVYDSCEDSDYVYTKGRFTLSCTVEVQGAPVHRAFSGYGSWTSQAFNLPAGTYQITASYSGSGFWAVEGHNARGDYFIGPYEIDPFTNLTDTVTVYHGEQGSWKMIVEDTGPGYWSFTIDSLF